MNAHNAEGVRALVDALKMARQYVEDWGAYAPDWAQAKHGLADDLAELDFVIAQFDGGQDG
jgi:hypothetical protein